MKKLMIAAAIVCAAAMSQAAAINWAASSVNYVTKDGTVQTAATADKGTFVLCLLEGGDWSKATVVNEGTVAYGSGKSGSYARASGAYSFTYGAEGAPVNGDIFGVMFRDEEGNLSKLATTGGAEIDTTFTITGMSTDTWGGTFDFAQSNYTVASVPEPTSGLLLLLGVAGMALRRRRA